MRDRARSLRSDNNAGLCPEALAALQEAAAGHAVAYGDDRHTAEAIQAFRGIFGERTGVFFVATGTAANTLSIAALTEPWQQVVCHVHSHYNDDESTAPEHITGCRMCQVRSVSSKLEPADIAMAALGTRGDVHQPQPGVVTISNPTEFGTVYTPPEVAALCDEAHRLGFRVHVDGARFANAVAAAGCAPRELSVDAGVDALSFGGTKNGLAWGEAVLFFPQGDGQAAARAIETFPFHRKRNGHLLSKHRFVAAPFTATLSGGGGGTAGGGPWLKHARHANAMARRLADGLKQLGVRLRFPCQANGVFAELPPEVHAALQAAGHGYYPFGDPNWSMYRLMCSFDTQPGDVDAFLADARAALGR